MWQVMAWVLGEYGHVSDTEDIGKIIEWLIVAIEQQFDDESTRSWILSSLMKLSAQMDSIPPEVGSLITRYQSSLMVDLQQRAHEFVELIKNPDTMRRVLPIGENSIDIEVDEKLSFLDGYVQTALANGAQPFQEGREIDSRDRDRAESWQKNQPKSLVFAPYTSGNNSGGR